MSGAKNDEYVGRGAAQSSHCRSVRSRKRAGVVEYSCERIRDS
nr:MAG TPA: hypothetical protein [Caudoviricetes sp.]